MGKHQTITADVSEEMASTIHDVVASGQYASVSDVVRHALTEWRIAEHGPKLSPQDVQALVEASLAEDDEGEDVEIVFARLLSEIDVMIEADERAA